MDLENIRKLNESMAAQKACGIKEMPQDDLPRISIGANPASPGKMFIRARNIDLTQKWGKDAIKAILEPFRKSPNGIDGICIIDEATGEDLVAKLKNIDEINAASSDDE